MPKQTVIVNSHSLSDFQQCEQRYMFTTKISIEPLVSKQQFDDGSFFHLWLKTFYKYKIRLARKKSVGLMRKLLVNSQAWQHIGFKRWKLDGTKTFQLFRILSKYSHTYKNENWKPIGTEVGFSRVLYEDENYIFVYEGSADLVAYVEDELIVVDHKTRSGKYKLYEFNNQARGYLWATGATKFVYNYITLTQNPSFEREVFSFTPEQIEDWRKDTIEWCKRIAATHESGKYLRSWQCSGKYGVCDYHRICEATKVEQQLFTIKSTFKYKEPHRSW